MGPAISRIADQTIDIELIPIILLVVGCLLTVLHVGTIVIFYVCLPYDKSKSTSNGIAGKTFVSI